MHFLCFLSALYGHKAKKINHDVDHVDTMYIASYVAIAKPFDYALTCQVIIISFADANNSVYIGYIKEHCIGRSYLYVAYTH